LLRSLGTISFRLIMKVLDGRSSSFLSLIDGQGAQQLVCLSTLARAQVLSSAREILRLLMSILAVAAIKRDYRLLMAPKRISYAIDCMSEGVSFIESINFMPSGPKGRRRR
jgi:hypothetical protein